MTGKDTQTSGAKLAAIAALITVPFAALTQVCFGIASGGDVTIFFDGAAMLSLAPDTAQAFRNALWFDVAGYYLVFIPVILYLWRWLRADHGALIDLASLCGVIYCVMGALGAVIMASAHDMLTSLHSAASADKQIALQSAWEATIAAHWNGTWVIEMSLAAIWGLGIGLGLLNRRFRVLGALALLLSICWASFFIVSLLGASAIAQPLLIVVVILQPIWALIFAVQVWQREHRNERIGAVALA